MNVTNSSEFNLKQAHDLQGKGDLYFITLCFSLLAASVQTAKWTEIPFSNGLEIGGWFMLLVSGIAGLSRTGKIVSMFYAASDLKGGAHHAEESRQMKKLYQDPIYYLARFQHTTFLLGLSAIMLRRALEGYFPFPKI